MMDNNTTKQYKKHYNNTIEYNKNTTKSSRVKVVSGETL